MTCNKLKKKLDLISGVFILPLSVFKNRLAHNIELSSYILFFRMDGVGVQQKNILRTFPIIGHVLIKKKTNVSTGVRYTVSHWKIVGWVKKFPSIVNL